MEEEEKEFKPVMFSLDSLMNQGTSNTISRKEKIALIKDSLHLLTSIKNAGVMEGGDLGKSYKNLFLNEDYVYQMEDYIMSLSKLLVDETKALFKNGKAK